MRQILDDSDSIDRKAASFAALQERYYGKKDILEAWESFPDMADIDYLTDLKRRLRNYHNDITYRGGNPDDSVV